MHLCAASESIAGSCKSTFVRHRIRFHERVNVPLCDTSVNTPLCSIMFIAAEVSPLFTDYYGATFRRISSHVMLLFFFGACVCVCVCVTGFWAAHGAGNSYACSWLRELGTGE